DQGHNDDIVQAISESLQSHAEVSGFAIESHDIQSKRKWVSKDFFAFHVKENSLLGRRAPVYWQLSTQLASYSIWIYYHRFSKDTFFKVNDVANRKLSYERQRLDRLRG